MLIAFVNSYSPTRQLRSSKIVIEETIHADDYPVIGSRLTAKNIHCIKTCVRENCKQFYCLGGGGEPRDYAVGLPIQSPRVQVVISNH